MGMKAAVRTFAALMVTTMILGACGGGDDDEPAAPVDGSATTSPAPERLRIGVLNPFIATDYLNLVADKKGMFDKHGIDPEFVTSTEPVTPLLSGDLDVANMGANGLVAVSQGRELVFVACTFPTSTVALLVKPNSPVTAVAHKWPDVMVALKGKKVGVTVAGAQIDNTARYMAGLAGLTPDKDITVQAAGNATTLVANLEAGTYDAALVPSPLFETVLARGTAVSVLDVHKGEGPPELKTLPYATPGMTKKFVDEHPGLAQKYYDSIDEAIKWVKTPANLAELTTLVATEVKADPATLKAPLETFLGVLETPKYTRDRWNSATAMMTANGIDLSKAKYENYVFKGAQD